jgi:WD40 repeat protein
MKGGGAAHWRRQKLTVGMGNNAVSQVSPLKTGLALNFGSTTLSTPSKAQQASSDTHEISAEELERIQVSEPFGSFMELAGRRMERALAQSASSFDILHSYTQSGNDSVRRTSESQILSDLACFECDFAKSRPVMDIQFSPHTASQQGLFLVAYGATGQAKGWQGAVGGHSSFLSSEVGASDDSAGVVCLWQAALPTSPEKRLIASSPVIAAQFHAEDQNIVIGGCHNGQVLLWDLRSSSPHPVQRSNLAGKGHRHPVTSLVAISSTAAYELVSVSSDGQICHWDVQRLSDPVTSTFATTSTSASGSAPADSTSSSSTAINVSCTVLGLGEGEASKEVRVTLALL